MSNTAASFGMAPGRTRWSLFGRSMLIVAAWHVIPAASITVQVLLAGRQQSCVDTCGWAGIGAFVEGALALISLALATALAAFLSSLAKRFAFLRRATLVGNVAGVSGMVMTVYTLVMLWVALQS